MTENSKPNSESSNHPPISQDTLLCHDQIWDNGAIVPPITQSSLFSFENYADMVERFRGEGDACIYSRIDNPTVLAFEEKMALLELGDDALAFASGMAAISAAILANVRSGDKIICVRNVYPDAYRLFEGFLPNFGIKTEYIDGNDLTAIAEALPEARVLYLESPTTMNFETQDLSALSELARAHNVTTIIDNSYATPINQNPLSQGIDIVVHSASKYISGHSDTVAGVLISNQKHVDQIRKSIIPVMGGKLGPFEAWLLLRGLRTLSVRMTRHRESALELIDLLKRHPDINKIYFADEKNTPCLRAQSGLFSVDLDPSIDVPSFVDHLKIFRLGVSWGGHESLVMPVKASLEQAGSHTSVREFGIPETLVRLNIGLEDTQDLWADLQSALRQADRRN